jgi:hypothetical protein
MVEWFHDKYYILGNCGVRSIFTWIRTVGKQRNKEDS